MNKYSRILLGFILTVSFCVPVFALNEVYVTSIDKTPGESSGIKSDLTAITLNNKIKIKEIQIVKSGEKTTLKYPVYISKNGKKYPQVELLTKQVNDEITRAITTGEPSIKPVQPMTFKIAEFIPFKNSKSSRKANVSVDFNESVRISCGVMDSNKGPWISWPSRKSEDSGIWIKQVLVTDKKMREVIEKAIINKYKSLMSETSEEE
ncbi:MAG: septation protein SpoVG family protein [Elusimicrobia bacterium]|nr:septation protein SpoVG family protein [Elusimicrobiota bacterium]